VLDDVFALHSSVLNDVSWLPRFAAQLLVATPALFWVLRYMGDIKRTRFVILFAALASLAASVLVDRSGVLSGDTALLVEDGFKFLGILAWTQYFAMTSRDIADSAISGRVVPALEADESDAAFDESEFPHAA